MNTPGTTERSLTSPATAVFTMSPHTDGPHVRQHIRPPAHRQRRRAPSRCSQRMAGDMRMPEFITTVRDVAAVAVGGTGRVEETGDRLLAFRHLDREGAEVVSAVTEFLHTCSPMMRARRR